jgi:hypothetical protein
MILARPMKHDCEHVLVSAPDAAFGIEFARPDAVAGAMYGHEGCSWHNIGVAAYEVAASPVHRWYYYPRMTRDEVLLMKTYDSRGVVGRSCPHASFANPAASAGTPPRRSAELRVLCYLGAS